MVLLYNVYLTDTSGNPYSGLSRGLLPSYSKLDITKYSLASLAVAYSWTRAIINVELDPRMYTEVQSIELKEFIEKEFKDVEVLFSSKRVKFQHEWKDLYEKINSDLILLICNHDHIFIDSSRETLEEVVKQEHSKYTTIVMSHWPENIRWAKSGYIELNESKPAKLNSNYKVLDYALSYEGLCIDSLNIVTKQLYYDWFFTGEWEEIGLPRVDGITGQYPDLLAIRKHLGIPLPQQTLIIPYKEQLRHFDGYLHQRIDNNTCPSLNIPEGFFESNIKIRYGYSDYVEGWVNINPKFNNYKAYSLDGIDYKITLEDLPLVWKNKVADLDINPYVKEEEMIQYRLKNALSMMYSDARYNAYLDSEVEQKVLNQYLKVYKQYQLI
jgi:hypothetical protein